MAMWILVKIGSGNGLLPDGTKPLPEPIYPRAILHEIVKIWYEFQNH